MKLKLATPNNDIDCTYSYTVISEGKDAKTLMAEGREYALSKETDRADLNWHGDVLIGEEPILSTHRWEMELANGSILIID